MEIFFIALTSSVRARIEPINSIDKGVVAEPRRSNGAFIIFGNRKFNSSIVIPIIKDIVLELIKYLMLHFFVLTCA